MTPSTILPTPNQHSFTTPNAYLSEPDDDDVNVRRVDDEMRVCASENESRERSERRPGVDLHDRRFGTDVERSRPHSLNEALSSAQRASTRASSVSASVNSRDGWPTPHESISLSVLSKTRVNRGDASSRPTYAQALGTQAAPTSVYTLPVGIDVVGTGHATTLLDGAGRRYGLPSTSSAVDATSFDNFPPLQSLVNSSFGSGPDGKPWLTLTATSPKGASHHSDTSHDVPPASVEPIDDILEAPLPDPDFLTPSNSLPSTHASSPPIPREKASVPIEKLPPHRTSSSDPAAISARINGISSPAVISSTLPTDCISPRLASLAELEPEPLSPSSSSLVASSFTLADISGTVEAELTIGEDGVLEMRRFFVVDMKGECVLGVPFLRGHTVIIEPRANLVEVDGTVESLISRQEVVRLQAQMSMREMERMLKKDHEEEISIDPSPTLTMDSLPQSDDTDDTLFSSSDSDNPSVITDGLQLNLSLPSPRLPPSSLPPVVEKGPMLVVLGTINGYTALIGIDTSSPIDILSPAFVAHSKLTPFSLPQPHYPHIPTSSAVLADKIESKITHGIHAVVSLAGRATWDYFDISPSLQGIDAIFGMPYLRRHDVRVDFSNCNRLLVQNERTAWGVSSETYERHRATLASEGVAFPDGPRVEVDLWEAMGLMKGRVGRAGADLRARCGPGVGLYTSSTADVRHSSPEDEVLSGLAFMDEDDGLGHDLELDSGYGSDRD